MSDSLQSHGLYSPWNSPGQNTGVGSRSLLQKIFPTQESNLGFLHCGWILYQLSHKGSNAGDPWFDSWVGKIHWRRARLPTPVFLGLPVTQLVKNPPTMQETWVQSLGRGDSLEKGKAAHSSILAWRISWAV